MKKMSTLKRRLLSLVLVLASVFTILPATSASAAESYNGGWAFSKSNQTVYGSANTSNPIGSIGWEGITVLSQSGNTAYIEYSTSNGAKRGYLINPNLDTSFLSKTCVAKVSTGSTIYYGNNTSTYQVAGSVSSGEYVAVIAKINSWVYVEYNTNSGRKRGYMLYANLTCYNRPTYFYDFYMQSAPSDTITTLSQLSVYSGPNESYAKVGYIDSTDGTVPCYYEYSYGNGEVFHYIEYTVSGQKKSGFVRWDLY